MILFGLGCVKRLKISVGGFFFFFSCYGLVVVAAAIVGVADGRGGCDWCCGCFLASG